VLFQDGRTDWKIHLSSQADPTEAFAAEELREALKKTSGADFEIVSTDEVPGQRAIVIGDLKNPLVLARAGELHVNPGKVEEIAVYTLGGRLYLAGKLGHVAVIPEVSLSPKLGPDVYAHHVQNRLSIYLYARLPWDPDQPMSEVLRDWCQTAFGEAAAPMVGRQRGKAAGAP
jgi:hypothetical protein